uniref:Endo-beta-1,2-glucanase SGL domain-containing protein n=1 Tax=Alexandrium monilatum TaxID=311494 RepID=A0A7S4S048_9DINO
MARGLAPSLAAVLGCLGAAASGVCRFGPSYDWDRLPADPAVQDAYVAAMLSWDGKFVSAGKGMSSHGLTCDHVNINADGSLTTGSVCAAAYTAPSKESLHIEMLALVVSRTRLAWYWIDGAADENAAVTIAVQRLTTIMDAYEAFRTQYPGLGGFFPWIGVGSNGFKLRNASGVSLPVVGNGQLAWAMVAAATALTNAGETALASRYSAYVVLLGSSINTLYLRPDGRPATTAQVTDATQPLSTGNVVQTGIAAAPYESELAVMFMDLYGNWSDPSRKTLLWQRVKASTAVAKELSNASLPNGPITVQRGWRFSSHELWKYMVLPYLDNAMASRVFKNGERARSWHSHLQAIPGLLASSYDASNRYRDTFGILELSMGYTPAADSDLMVTPYGSFPLMLADRGHGLAWHRAMVSRPLMQSEIGSVESSQAFQSPPQVAMKASWDTKVTSDLAALGGAVDLLRTALQDSGRYARFMQVLSDNYQGWGQVTIRGEATPFAPPPGLPASDDVSSPSPDFASCRRLATRQAVTLLPASTAVPTTSLPGHSASASAPLPVLGAGSGLLVLVPVLLGATASWR